MPEAVPASILVLEDDPNMREILVEALEDEGYFVRGAGSADEALRTAAKGSFDLVVADVRMAGMDGIDCLGALKKTFPDLRCIVITGYTSEDAPGRALQVEVDDYLYKPFDLKMFRTAVRRVLEAGQERAGYRELLQAVRLGYRRLVRKAGEVLAEASLGSVDRERDRAFQAFYVGIRSGHLSPGTALKVWDRMEPLEEEREKLRAGNPVRDASALRDGYRYVVDLILAMARAQVTELSGPRDAGQIDRESFRALFDRIKEGHLSCEQLKLAPLFRCLPPAEVERSPELQELRLRIWGAVA